jgi:hypothetical protein
MIEKGGEQAVVQFVDALMLQEARSPIRFPSR